VTAAGWRLFLRNSCVPSVTAVLLISGLLLACGGGGGGGGGGSSTEVTGYVGDGPIENAAVNCYQVDTNGQKTVSINDSSANPNGVSTASDGSFTLLTASASGPVLCTSTNGTDITNNVPAPDLSVMIPNGVPAGTSVTANLTTLTTVATKIVQSGTPPWDTPVTSTMVSDALSIVADAYGLTGCDLLKLVPLVPPNSTTCPPLSNPNLSPPEDRYQQILDELSAIATNGPEPDFDTLMTALASDLAVDKILDGLDDGTPIYLCTPTPCTPTLAQIISQPPGHPGSTKYSLLDTVIGLQFTPAASACSSNCVNMVLNATKSLPGAGVLAIDVNASSITAGSVFGAAFDVNILDSTVTQWYGSGFLNCTTESQNNFQCSTIGFDSGGFLEGPSPYFEVNYFLNLLNGTDPNTLIVGASEHSPETGVTGSGTIVTLYFQRESPMSGSSTLRFNNNVLYDSTNSTIGVTWGDGTNPALGGTVTIVPYPYPMN
jgi:hypothetical protein